jgi:mannose-1-phosphate guanylyltransferase
MTSISKAMILAAGSGTRLGALTASRPKPMLELNGKPLLEYVIRRLAHAGVTDAVVNTHQHAETIPRHFGDGSAFGVRLTYSHEPTLMGTAGAVKQVEPFFSAGPFLLAYGDNLTTCDFSRLADTHRASGAIATVALFWKQNAAPHSAVDFDADGRITSFVEKPRAAAAAGAWISAGIAILEPAVFSFIDAGRPSDFGFDVFPRLVASGQRLQGYQMSEDEGLWWIDTPADYARVQALWDEGIPPFAR